MKGRGSSGPPTGKVGAFLAGSCALLAWGLGAASAAALPTRPLEIFSIAKSENKNQVVYFVNVDADCAPASGAPIFAYWRMLEKGPSATAPLLAREVDAYGAASQAIVEHTDGGGKLRLVLRALPDRPILVETTRGGDGACRVLATVTVAGTPAHLFNVYARVKWLFGVDYLLLRAWSLDGSRVITEKIVK
jgi:hypothetical protein